jgi:hypothetical protein
MFAHCNDAGRAVGVVLYDHPITASACDPDLKHGFRIAQTHGLTFGTYDLLQGFGHPGAVIATEICHPGLGQCRKGKAEATQQEASRHHVQKLTARFGKCNMFMTLRG